jgi:hypothetical protein
MAGGVHKSEPEITAPVDLCRPDGRLNPAAVGWSRRPLHRCNLQGWGRNKRFEYWCVTTPDLAVALNVSHGDYRVTLATFFLDIATKQGFSQAEIHWLPRGRCDPMSERSGQGDTVGRGDAMRIEMRQTAVGVKLFADTPRLKIDLDVVDGPDRECMGVVVPWDDIRFQYTRKANCLPVSGRVVVDGVTRDIGGPDAFATLDHGRGRWPYSITWNWASGSGRSGGRTIGLQLGAKWTYGTPSTENSINIDGRVEKISQEHDWTYDRADWLKPWRIEGERVRLVFTPIYDRIADFDRLIVCSKEHQVFGWFDGEVVRKSGEIVPVERIFGWAEEVHRRW